MFTAAELASLPPRDKHYEFSGEYLLLYWSGHEYPIELNRIDTPLKALAWLHHVGRKSWPLADTEQCAMLIESLAERYAWDLWT